MKDDIDEMHKILPKQIIFCDDQHDKKRLQKLIDDSEMFYNNYICLLDKLSEMKSSLNSTINNEIPSKQQQASSIQAGDSKTLGGSSTHGSQNSSQQSQKTQNQIHQDTLVVNGSSSSVVVSPQNKKQKKRLYEQENQQHIQNKIETQQQNLKEEKETLRSPKRSNNLQQQQQTLNSQKISTKSSQEETELNKTFTSQIINLKGRERINLQIRYLKDIYELIVILVKNSLNKLEIFQPKPPVLDEFDDFVKFRKIIEMDRHIISLIDSEKHKCFSLANDIILKQYIKDVKLSQELIQYTPQFLKVLGDLIQTYQECLTPDLEAYVTSYNEFAKLTLNAKSIQLLRNLFYNLLCFIVKKEIIYIKIPFFIEKIERAFYQIANDRFFFVGLSEEQKEIEEDLQQINIIIATFQDKEDKFNQITYTLHRLQLIYRRIRDYHTIFFTSNEILPNYNDFHPFIKKLYDHIFKGGDEEPLIQESTTLITMLEIGNHKLENDFHNVSEKPKFIPVLEKINDITENLIYMLKTINQSRESINFFSLLQVLHAIGEYFLIKKEPVVLLRDSKNAIVFIQPLIRQAISQFYNQLQPNQPKGMTPSSNLQQFNKQQSINNQSKCLNTSMMASFNKSNSVHQLDELKQNSDNQLQSTTNLYDESQLVLQSSSPLVLQIQKNLLYNEYFGLAKNKNKKRFSNKQLNDEQVESEELDSDQDKDKEQQQMLEQEQEQELEWFEYVEQMEDSRVITEENEISLIQTCVSFRYNRKEQAIIVLIPQSPFSLFNFEVADIDTNQIIHKGAITNNSLLTIPLQINSPYGLFSLRLYKKYFEDNQMTIQKNPSLVNQKATNNNPNEILSKSLYIKTITNNNGTSLESNFAQNNTIEASQFQFMRFEQDQALLVKSMLVNKYNLNEYPINFKALEKYVIFIQRQTNVNVQYFIKDKNNQKQNIQSSSHPYIQLIQENSQNQQPKIENSLIKIEKQSGSNTIEDEGNSLPVRKHSTEKLGQLTTDLMSIKDNNFEEFELILEIESPNINQNSQDLVFPIVYIYKKQQNDQEPQPIVIQKDVSQLEPKNLFEISNNNKKIFIWNLATFLEENVEIINCINL